MRFRVVVHNVSGFRGGLDTAQRIVDRFAPDVVLLNETGSRRRLRRFARRVRMRAVADPWSPFRRRAKNAVLVRPPWRMLDRRSLRFAGSARLHPRGAIVASIGQSGYRVRAVSVHLGLQPSERLRHVEELSDALRGLGGPIVLGGDLNETPDRRAASFLGERFWDAWLLGGDAAGETFPSAEPTARIDFLFVSEGVTVERVVVPGDEDARRASDHRPVIAELTLAEPG